MARILSLLSLAAVAVQAKQSITFRETGSTVECKIYSDRLAGEYSLKTSCGFETATTMSLDARLSALETLVLNNKNELDQAIAKTNQDFKQAVVDALEVAKHYTNEALFTTKTELKRDISALKTQHKADIKNIEEQHDKDIGSLNQKVSVNRVLINENSADVNDLEDQDDEHDEFLDGLSVKMQDSTEAHLRNLRLIEEVKNAPKPKPVNMNLYLLKTDTDTVYPTSYPTAYPTPFPTPFPTAYPTPYPTPFPTSFPTSFPTPWPTPHPTRFPTPQVGRSCSQTYPGWNLVYYRGRCYGTLDNMARHSRRAGCQSHWVAMKSGFTRMTWSWDIHRNVVRGSSDAWNTHTMLYGNSYGVWTHSDSVFTTSWGPAQSGNSYRSRYCHARIGMQTTSNNFNRH